MNATIDAMAGTAWRLLEEMKAHPRDLVVYGLETRGVPVGRRIAEDVEGRAGIKIPFIRQRIRYYGDDLGMETQEPVVARPAPIDLSDKVVLIADDVFWSASTMVAALALVMSLGRPRRVINAQLVDRGHRIYPVTTDIVGCTVQTEEHHVVKVQFTETGDLIDQVLLMRR